jgi:hypothetical protein
VRVAQPRPSHPRPRGTKSLIWSWRLLELACGGAQLLVAGGASAELAASQLQHLARTAQQPDDQHFVRCLCTPGHRSGNHGRVGPRFVRLLFAVAVVRHRASVGGRAALRRADAPSIGSAIRLCEMHGGLVLEPMEGGLGDLMARPMWTLGTAWLATSS